MVISPVPAPKVPPLRTSASQPQSALKAGTTLRRPSAQLSSTKVDVVTGKKNIASTIGSALIN